jgi:hypothetical protein
MEAIHTSIHDDSSGTASKTSDKITEKIGHEMKDLSFKVNPELTEEVMHHAGL